MYGWSQEGLDYFEEKVQKYFEHKAEWSKKYPGKKYPPDYFTYQHHN